MCAMSRKGVSNYFSISLKFRFAIQLQTRLETCLQWLLRSLQLEETEQLITVVSADQACNIVIKVFTCIRTAWNRVRNMFAMVLTTITTIWRPDLKAMQVELFLDENCLNSCELLMIETKTNFASYCFKEIAYNIKVGVSHRMDKRKSFVFAKQYRNYFSRRIKALVPRN